MTGDVIRRPDSDPQSVSGAEGLLGELNRAGHLDAGDVHTALRIAAISGQTHSEEVLVATALTARVVRAGSVCLDLYSLGDLVEADDISLPDGTAFEAALRACPLVAGITDSRELRPLRLVSGPGGPLLYFDRYFRQEQTVRAVLAERARSRPHVDRRRLHEALDRFFGPPSADAEPDRQRLAAAVAATSWTTVLAGGPGTGKTRTVSRLLAVLEAVGDGSCRVALAAPTGRAAANLAAAVHTESVAMGRGDHVYPASTVHRLLGTIPGAASRFRHNPTNPLPLDTVIIDEASMMSLTLMCRVLQALRPNTRLILVGDPDQLASVDAGAVLADLVARKPQFEQDSAALVGVLDATPNLEAVEATGIRAGTITLRRGYRFNGEIAALADAIRRADTARVLELVAGNGSIDFCGPEELEGFETDVTSWGQAMHDAAEAGDAHRAIEALNSHRVLCAHRDGRYGASWWSRRVHTLIDHSGLRIERDGWYSGQPVLVTANDPRSQTFNGDTGVVITDENGRLRVAFERQTRQLLHPAQLSSITQMYAMTIHRSQGSQYKAVSVVIPPADSKILTRELLYTAVTRAREGVRLIGTEEDLIAGVRRQVLRASGLRAEITESVPPQQV